VDACRAEGVLAINGTAAMLATAAAADLRLWMLLAEVAQH